MKKRILSILIIAILITTSAASITLAKSGIKTYKVHNSCYTQLEVSGGKGKIKWSSSDKKIATVNSKGKVKGIKAGTCTITAKRGNSKATCKIKVLSYYKDYSKVPDFGAVVGKCTSDSFYKLGLCNKVYTASDPEQATEWITKYEKKLKKNYTEDDDNPGIWARGSINDGNLVRVIRDGKTITVSYTNIYNLSVFDQ